MVDQNTSLGFSGAVSVGKKPAQEEEVRRNAAQWDAETHRESMSSITCSLQMEEAPPIP